MSSGTAVDHELLDRVREALADDIGRPSPTRVAEAVRSAGLVIGGRRLLDVVDAVQAELSGAGPLEPLVADPDVTDVLVNGVDGVWVDRGSGLQRVDVDLGGPADVRRLAVRLAAVAGRRLDDASPWVDARLPDGTRLHAVLPPVVQGAAHVSLRIPRRSALSLSDLVTAGTVPPGWEPVLRALVLARAAYLVTGGTGAGKTTLLAALLALVSPAERVVVVEDAAELFIDHPHVIRLEGRAANVEGAGEVPMTDLVRQALRMRPDRLVVGEVRGPEVRDLLGALNTGHEGGCGTVHANASADLPARLEALGALAGMSREAVQAQAGSAVEVVVHMRRREGRRCVTELAVVEVGPTGLRVAPALVRRADDTVTTGSGWPALAERLDLHPSAVRCATDGPPGRLAAGALDPGLI
jgi:pilus assembly protein CpaF